MKLNSLSDEEHHILQLIVQEFYIVLPAGLKTYSLFATHILSSTLHHYGIKTRVLPCRLWCSLMQQEKEIVGGFLNYGDLGKWNGHVICLVGDWLVDAALYHLNPRFGAEVPKLLARRIVHPEADTFVRYQLNKETEFIWYRLPPQVQAVPLTGYESHMEKYVSALTAHVDLLLNPPDELVNEVAEGVGQVEDDGGGDAEISESDKDAVLSGLSGETEPVIENSAENVPKE